MENKYCLNCNNPVSGKYCSNCGQKSDTHRITFKHFVLHDIMHGVFHFEKGMLFTAKQALVRPGKAALDYIYGKRINYYNIFYFILLLIGINLFLGYCYEIFEKRVFAEYFAEREFNEAGIRLHEILNTYTKLMILTVVPVFGIKSYLFFRRKKLNLTEHFILSGILLLGVALIYTIINTLTFLGFIIDSENLKTYLIYFCFPFLAIGYAMYGYFNAFREDYALFGILIRLIFLVILILVELYATVFLFLLFFVGKGNTIIYSL